jgi:predicted dienelactone hydrolase
LEIVFVLLTTAWLILTNRRGVPAAGSVGLALCAAGFGVALAALALGQARLHMAPAALVFAALACLLPRRGYSHVAVRAFGATLGAVLVSASVTLAIALPVVDLPAPRGPHTVGVTSFTLVDDSRDDALFGAPGRPREIYVQAWYPADAPRGHSAPRPRTLWQELYRPPVLDVLFGYLGGMKTHSYEDLPLATARESYPAIVFSPSLGGIAEQNTLLMEQLASFGYIVLGVTHPHFGLFTTYADGSGAPTHEKAIEAMTQQGGVDLRAITARAERSGSELEAASIRLEYFEHGALLNDLMETWERDLALLLDAMTTPGGAHTLAPVVAGHVDTSRIGLLGMSYGGGAVTQVCKSDARCRAALNLDGGLWGSKMRQPLTVPYLVLASPANAPFFQHDLLTSAAPYYAVTVEGASHANFTDVSMFVPLFRWLGVTGSIDGARAVEIMNVVATQFFDAYLRDSAAPTFDLERFPELRTQTNLIELRKRKPTQRLKS